MSHSMGALLLDWSMSDTCQDSSVFYWVEPVDGATATPSMDQTGGSETEFTYVYFIQRDLR